MEDVIIVGSASLSRVLICHSSFSTLWTMYALLRISHMGIEELFGFSYSEYVIILNISLFLFPRRALSLFS